MRHLGWRVAYAENLRKNGPQIAGYGYKNEMICLWDVYYFPPNLTLVYC